MEINWLKRTGSREVVLFFNGWGMDQRAVSHVEGELDVCEVHDYRDIERGIAPDLDAYEAVNVVAWSMGVWAASLLVGRWNLCPRRMVALNGTECPVDDRYGIPVKGYILTERGMDERGREKFFRRMLTSNDRDWFSGKMPERPLAEQVEELHCIREQAARMHGKIGWDRVFVSTGDVIFPPENQRNWWGERCRKVISLEGGHYPFRELDNWDLILHDDF